MEAFDYGQFEPPGGAYGVMPSEQNSSVERFCLMRKGPGHPTAELTAVLVVLPMQPTVTRWLGALAPQTEEGTIVGKTCAARAAARLD